MVARRRRRRWWWLCVVEKLELELIQPHMAQKPVLRGEVWCACVAREVSAERGGMRGKKACFWSTHFQNLLRPVLSKGKRLGQRACIGRVAQGKRGGGMRLLGVFENWAGKCVLDFDLKRPTATLVA